MLLWKLDARAVLALVARVGWGLVPVLALPLGALVLNAAGWRLSFAPEDGRCYPLPELGKLWLAMEGLNYLVPTGTLGGEVARATMLGEGPPPEVRTASVVTSRFSQTIAQVAFVLAGFVFLVSRLPLVQKAGWITPAAAALLGLLAAGFVAYLLFARRWIPVSGGEPPPGESRGRWLRRIPGRLGVYFGRHPGRFAAAMALFFLAYAWTTIETWLICRFISLPVNVRTALTIEVLSVAVDGLLFIVPAKVGTQELGKTAIFSFLVLPPRSGLAFGIVRHLRELAWAVTGLLVYASRLRRAAGRMLA